MNSSCSNSDTRRVTLVVKSVISNEWGNYGVVITANGTYSWSFVTRGFAFGFVNYKNRCTRPAAASDKVYQLLAHGWWFSPGTPASSTTKTGRHDIVEILLKVTLNTKI